MNRVLPLGKCSFPYVILFAVTDMLLKTYKKKIEAQKIKFMMQKPENGPAIVNAKQVND